MTDKIKKMQTKLVEQVQTLLAPGEPRDELITLVDELQPYDLYLLLQELDTDEQFTLLKSIPPEIAAETMEHFEPLNQYQLLSRLNHDAAVQILNHLSSDNMVQLFAALHPRQAERLFSHLKDELQEKIRGLMSYPENTAGSLANVEYVAARHWWTAEQTLDHLRRVGDQAELYKYIYILDSLGKLVGVLSLRDLILADPATPIAEIMVGKPVTAPAEMDQEEAARILGNYNLVALPVVTDSGRMVGIITVDDILDIIEEEATEDIHLLGGSQPLDNPYLQSGIFSVFRKRIVWLALLFVAGATTSNILQHYEGLLDQIIVLTFFIPLLIDTGGNAGAQTSTMIIRAMVLGDVGLKDYLKVILKEIRLGLALGLAMATFGFFWAMFLRHPVALGLTISATLAAIVTVSSTIAATLPIIGKRLGIDPAVFSAPMITTVVDALGLLIYFQFARIMMGI